MSDTDKVQDISELTLEERAVAWEKWVRSEISAALDIFLPLTKAGDVYTAYRAHKVEELETGPVYDNTKADGVSITVVFEFEKPVDLTKPREEQE